MGAPKGSPKVAGRKKGVPNIKTRERIEAAAALGLLPHEFLLAVAQARVEDIDGEIPTLDQRIDAAKAAAPFYAPKLSNIEVSGKDGGPLEFTFCLDSPKSD